MEKATQQIVQHLTANLNLNKKQIMLYNFIGGLSWGFGTVVGATVVVTILVYIGKHLGILDTLGAIFGAGSGVGQISTPTPTPPFTQ